jgi:hypothetical protein
MLRKYEWNMQDIWDTMKRPNLQIMGVEEREEIQTKGIDNLFNRIIAENFPNLEKENHQGAGNLQNTKLSGSKKKHPQTHHNQNTQHTQQKKRIRKATKEKRSHTKANPLE